jgi:pyruvate ferredoxin oxidoreductase delta subunit
MSESRYESGTVSNLLPVTNPTIGAAGKTGEWRIYRPVVDKGKCTHCLLCWVFCPEGCIELTPKDDIELNLDYCKGCGICAQECRLNAITMRREET